MAAVSPSRATIGRLSPLPCLVTWHLHVCYISQLLRDSFSVSQQPPNWEPPSHYSMSWTPETGLLDPSLDLDLLGTGGGGGGLTGHGHDIETLKSRFSDNLTLPSPCSDMLSPELCSLCYHERQVSTVSCSCTLLTRRLSSR